jgi:hypothetical protein
MEAGLLFGARNGSTLLPSGGLMPQARAIAIKDAPHSVSPVSGWKDPASGEWIRTFAIITTDSNELVARLPNFLTRPAHRPPFFVF